MVNSTFVKIVNILLLIFFVGVVINSLIIVFHLVNPLEPVKKGHEIIGWIFIGIMFIHILVHLRYYKAIFNRK